MLAGQTALVTGSSRGIGRAIAVCLGERGADVAVNYRSDEAAAGEVVDLLRRLGRRALAIRADVSDPSEVATMAATAQKELGPIDILVNNVGEFTLKSLADTSEREWAEILASNLSSAFYTSRHLLRDMRARRRGRVVNIGLSPTHLVRAAPNVAPYAIAKTGLAILTRSLAAEEARYGITVNCVAPGLIDNGFLPPAQKRWMEQRVPLGRLGRPEDVAEAVAFLLSDVASYVSGATLAVAGGWDWEDRPTWHDEQVRSVFEGGT